MCFITSRESDMHVDVVSSLLLLQYGGIWLYPPDIKAPQGKARLLYEVREEPAAHGDPEPCLADGCSTFMKQPRGSCCCVCWNAGGPDELPRRAGGRDVDLGAHG